MRRGNCFLTNQNMATQTFNFQDGNGFVPAHRHINSDGSPGGWVAETAFVEPKCHIGYYARVYGNAYVTENACVYHRAQIYGNCVISGNAKVFDNAQVYDHALIYENSMIYDDAEIYEYAHVLGKARVFSRALICGYATVWGEAIVCGNAVVRYNVKMYGKDWLFGGTLKGKYVFNRNTCILRGMWE